MGAFLDIISFSAWNILWGVLIAAVCIALFLIGLKGWFKNAELSAWTYIVGAVLFVLIAIQSTMISGATKIISLTDYYEQQLTENISQANYGSDNGLSLGSLQESVVSGRGISDAIGTVIGNILGGNPDHEVSGPESTAIVEQLIDQYPILSNYFDFGVFEGYTVSQLPHAIACEIKDYMKWYILRRLLWCLGFVVIATFIAIKTIDHTNRGGYRRSSGYSSSGTSGLSSYDDEVF